MRKKVYKLKDKKLRLLVSASEKPGSALEQLLICIV